MLKIDTSSAEAGLFEALKAQMTVTKKAKTADFNSKKNSTGIC